MLKYYNYCFSIFAEEMNKNYQQFIDKSEKIVFDSNHRNRLNHNIGKYYTAYLNGLKQFAQLSKIQDVVKNIKQYSVDNLSNLLEEFEANAKKNGTEVYWANNTNDVHLILNQLFTELQPKIIVKSKSMVHEEIEFNHFAKEHGINSVETDLGEFIVQTAGEKPYHILTPAMHKSKEDVNILFNKHFGVPLNSTPTEMTVFAREHLRYFFQNADIGVTGGNFLISSTGSVCLTENEGNAFLSFSLPKVIISIVGIEKIVPDLKSLAAIYPLLATKGTGQKLTVYNSILSGPKRQSETNGPDRMIVILLDNGRTKLYADNDNYSALRCIRCGSCLNVCPIYKNIGGYTYSAVYTGPIGSVISPYLNSFETHGHLSMACSLCNRCKDMCPVELDLPKMILNNRTFYYSHYSNKIEKAGYNVITKALKSNKLYNFFKPSIVNAGIKMFGKLILGKGRKMSSLPVSFKQQFKSKHAL